MLTALLAVIAALGGMAVAEQRQGSDAGAPTQDHNDSAIRAVNPDPGVSAGRVDAPPRASRVPASSTTERTTLVSSNGDIASIDSRADEAPASSRQTLVRIKVDTPIRSKPGSGSVVGTMPAHSKYLGSPMFAWVSETTTDGRFGKVTVPWQYPQVAGWIRMPADGVRTSPIEIRASVSERTVKVLTDGKVTASYPATVGASASPTPRGRYFVTDLTPVPASQPQFGTYAFGISAIQPNLPPGWTGGNQMAIHGTNDPSSIGRAASAGCLRVSEEALAELRHVIVKGTPVHIAA